MRIRTFEPGDDAAQVAIYNEAAAALPRFKPATLAEVRRRCTGEGFDPATRFYAEVDGQPVAYATFSESGRIGFPWCRAGFEQCRIPLLAALIEAMQAGGLTTAWTAYRADWSAVWDFFSAQGFKQTQQMLNFVLDLVEMPTPSGRGPRVETPLRPEDLPDLLALCPGFLRTRSETELRKHLFQNPYFPSKSVYSLRNGEGRVVAAAILIDDPTYTSPHAVDAQMPCFRLGAWGTEGLTHKRIKGGFSVLMPPTSDGQRLALDLLTLSAQRLEESDITALAAQVSDTQEHLVRFYRNHFRPQGSFPIFERQL